jgi:hypothetical protein
MVVTSVNMSEKREKMVRGIVEKFDGFTVVKDDGKVTIVKGEDVDSATARGLVIHLRHNYFDFQRIDDNVIYAVDTLEYADSLKGKFLLH